MSQKLHIKKERLTFKNISFSLLLFVTFSFMNSANAQTIPVSADAYVHPGNATTNYGSFWVMITKTGNIEGRLALLKFDISSLNSTDITAKLQIVPRNGTVDPNFGRNVFETTNNWTESGVNYDNRPTTGTLIGNFDVKPFDEGAFSEIDVTNYVKDAIDLDVDDELSFIIKSPDGSTTGVDFVTKEATIAENNIDGSVWCARLVISSSSLSIDDENVEISTSPNPVVNKLNISLAKTNLNLSKTNAIVYNINGVKVVEAKLSSINSDLDLSNLNKGIYILKVSDDTNQITKKIVKQ